MPRVGDARGLVATSSRPSMPSEEFGGLRLGDYIEEFVDGECHGLGLTREDLRGWRPAERKGRKKKG